MSAAQLLLLWVAMTPAGAGEGEGARAVMAHALRHVAAARVGDWVTYRYDGASASRRGYWRLAVVGEEKDGRGRDASWVEMEVGPHPEMRAPLLQMRLLVAREAASARDAVTRLVLAMGYERPREVSAATLAELAAHRQPPAEPASMPPGESRVRRGPPQALMTAAGTVTARPVEVLYRRTVLKRLWVSEQVPLLQLAKLEVPPIEHVMELHAYGTDAQPRIVLPAGGLGELALEDPQALSWIAGALGGGGPGGRP